MIITIKKPITKEELERFMKIFNNYQNPEDIEVIVKQMKLGIDTHNNQHLLTLDLELKE
jgi:hypothetical protein